MSVNTTPVHLPHPTHLIDTTRTRTVERNSHDTGTPTVITKRHNVKPSISHKDIYVTFSARNRGSSVLFVDRTVRTDHSAAAAAVLSATTHISPARAAKLSHMSADDGGSGAAAAAGGGNMTDSRRGSLHTLESVHYTNHSTISPRNLLALPVHSINMANNDNALNDSSVVTPNDALLTMPTYCRILEILLTLIGVLRINCTKHHGARYSCSYLWPLVIFLYQLINLFFVTITYNESINQSDTTQSSWLRYLSDCLANCAVLTAWIGCFAYIGYSQARRVAVFNALVNLELYNRPLVRSYVLGSMVAGAAYLCLLIGINSFQTILHQSIQYTINTVIYWLLNYAIVVCVMLCFVSLLARFHVNTLQLYQDSLFACQLTVTTAIQEHVVIMRLIHETASYVQYILGPSFVLSVSGALLNVYRILVTSEYKDTYSTIYTLLINLGILTLAMYNCSSVTSACSEISRLVQSIDMCEHLMERQALVQQLVLMPNNCWLIFSVNVTRTKLCGWHAW